MRAIARVAAVLLMALILAGSMTGRAGAEQANTPEMDPSANAELQIAACELAGGTASVETVRKGNGMLTVWVTCSGGLLDGAQCINNGAESTCYWLRTSVAAGANAPLTETMAPVANAPVTAPIADAVPIKTVPAKRASTADRVTAKFVEDKKKP